MRHKVRSDKKSKTIGNGNIYTFRVNMVGLKLEKLTIFCQKTTLRATQFGVNILQYTWLSWWSIILQILDNEFIVKIKHNSCDNFYVLQGKRTAERMDRIIRKIYIIRSIRSAILLWTSTVDLSCC